MTIKLTIDGRPIEVRASQTVLEAARQHGIEIPTLCHHRDLSDVGSCRLCVVEVDGIGGEPAACTLPVAEGMVVRTETPALAASRKTILELLLSQTSAAALQGVESEQTEFAHWVGRYGAQRWSQLQQSARYPVDSDPNPFIRVDLNLCILCTRCVRACAEVQGRFVWGVGYRGSEAKIIAGADTHLLDARCESCGACAAYCPTGALTDKPSAGLGKDDKRVTTTCPYCGVGCRFDLNVKDNTIMRVTSNPEAPVNGMHLCVKGRYGYKFVNHPDRLLRPRVRRYLLEGSGTRRPGQPRGGWVEVDWSRALEIVASKLHRVIRESGPDAVGVLSSAKCTNEENYLVQKFARQVIGTHNVDHCARLCHSSSVAAMVSCYGSGAMSNSMKDITEHARSMFIIGANVTEQHPVFGTMVRQSVLRRGTKLVVADPRRIDITELATLHLQHKPGTDTALVNGLMHVVLKNNWHDRRFIEARCEGFEEFCEAIEKYTPAHAAGITGVSSDDLCRAAELMARNRPMALMWGMGITQHTSGVLGALALGNLQMLLGNMGVPGGGANPLRGQNNVQGACDMGALPDVLPGYQRVTEALVRAKFNAAWQLAANDGNSGPQHTVQLGDKPGLTVTEMISAAGEGRLRALVVVGENPAMTEPDLNHAKRCLEACEFFVLQEIFPTETSQFADVLLPGVSWAEKQGTFTNTDRRIQIVDPAIDPLGEARADWVITSELARLVLRLRGCVPAGPQAAWDYDSVPAIMAEIALLTPQYAGVSYQRLARGEPLHWPVPHAQHPGTPILHVDKFTRGRGKFHATEYLPADELPDEQYPTVLTTGRVIYHWHGGEMTRRVEALQEVYPEALVEISPEDAAQQRLQGNDRVRVASRRGEIVARALVTDRVAPGLVFANFHFPGPQNANNLTNAAVDPQAKIPEYKVCAVRLEAV